MKSIRSVSLADHLWDLYGRMAEEMGSDREALVNQAMHVFARLNGYLLPAGQPERRREDAPPEGGEQRAVAEQVLETAALLEREVRAREAAPHEPVPHEPVQEAPRHGAPPPIPAGAAEGRVRELVVVRDDGTELPVKGERFLIGRGRHCDLVIDSTKISREHAAIVRDGDAWFIEDLASANGTWHRRERVERRRIEDGDEYFVCAERIRCQLR